MGGHFDISNLELELKTLHEQTLSENFYNDIKLSSEINIKISNLEKIINNYKELLEKVNTNLEFISLADEDEIEKISIDVDNLELNTYLNGEYDNLNCFLEIHAGAGGTESMDWTSMLLRMYERYMEKNSFKYEILSSQDGEEAGLKSVLIKVSGVNVFGLLKYESGIHRLVRISPFDSSKRRHTSFASVNVTPEFKKINDIEINENDLKIDVYHSSGAGGQSVNTSNSAVRITHIPSKIVVTCQNERSQLRNKEIAIEILKSKLYALELSKRESQISGFKNMDSINFGSQIRSYILEPYKLVKDHRTDYENNNPEKILDGEIKELLEFNLRNIK